MHKSILLLLVGCAVGEAGPGTSSASDDTAAIADDPAPVAGHVDAGLVSAGEAAGTFAAVPNCEDPTVHIVGSSDELAALIGPELTLGDSAALAATIDWDTQSALVAWSGCTDTCGRELTLEDAKVADDGSLKLSYELYNPHPWACDAAWSRAYAIHAIPRAAYGAPAIEVERTQPPSDTGW